MSGAEHLDCLCRVGDTLSLDAGGGYAMCPLCKNASCCTYVVCVHFCIDRSAPIKRLFENGM